MNVNKLKIILFFSFTYLATSPVLHAATPKSVETCESKYKTIAELSQCFDVVKENTDRELQTWINNQIFILEEFALKTGRRSALEMFKRSQRNFIAYRENNCRWQYLHISPDKKAAPTFKKCYILSTRDRIAELSRIN
jgi:uncharacterized protein YecT (DUF1311 family)